MIENLLFAGLGQQHVYPVARALNAAAGLGTALQLGGASEASACGMEDFECLLPDALSGRWAGQPTLTMTLRFKTIPVLQCCLAAERFVCLASLEITPLAVVLSCSQHLIRGKESAAGR